MTGCSESLSTCFLLPLFQFPSLSSPCGDRAKTLGAVCCADGRERPTVHFRDRRAEKWGRSRPTPCFGPVAFLCRLLRISLVFLGFARLLGDAQTERHAERHLWTPFTLIRRPWLENPAASGPDSFR